MSNAPAFQFYANDFMDATRFWEANAVGLYVRCLCIQWTQGGLPGDVRTIAKGLGMDFEEFERAWVEVASKFDLCEDGALRNSRLERVRSRQQQVSSKRSNAGKAGALAKANAKANGQAKNEQRKVKEKEKVEVEVGQGKEREGAKVIPLPFTSKEFCEAFAEFDVMRQKKGKPMTDRARKLILGDLLKWGEPAAIRSLNASTRAGWTDVYPPKDGPTKPEHTANRDNDLVTNW
jgi:uncharacterized protein YdaU (DUF1376 family)